MDVETYKVTYLHMALEAAYIPIHGVDIERNIHFKDEATQEQRDLAALIAAGWNTLTESIEITEPVIYIDVSPGETLITCSLPSYNFRLYKKADLQDSGTAPDGQLILDAVEKGIFIVEIIGSNYATGYVGIEVR